MSRVQKNVGQSNANAENPNRRGFLCGAGAVAPIAAGASSAKGAVASDWRTPLDELPPAERKARISAYDAAAKSEANQLLRELGEVLAEAEELLEKFADEGHDESCPCAFCQWVNWEKSSLTSWDMCGIQWAIMMFRGSLDPTTLKIPKEILSRGR